MTLQEDRYLQMREFSRVDAQIPLDVRPISAEEAKVAKSKISADSSIAYFTPPHDHEDRILTDWLKMLNDKLDTVLMLLTFHREGFSSLPYRQVNISGGGMSFMWSQAYPKGSILEIKMLLPMFPPVALYVYGELVSVDKRDSEWLLAVKFVNIEEEIRDEIVRFVFKKQRELLREKRK